MRTVKLVKKAKKGNKEALLQLITEQQDAYYRLALTYMGNSHDAMDALEDMIVSLYHSIPQLKKEESFYSWSKTILVNRCKKLLQQQNKIVFMEHPEDSLEEPVLPADPANYFTQTEQRMDLIEMLNTLNTNQQEAIKLKYLHDLDLQTISEMTNVSIGTVKSRIFQGLKKMREHFGGEWNE
ncbi:RNA polymerase sigma factor [Sporosarcina aquimarina]|uniref:Sigma-70 family RNA polymerase sigma factor n=1 Tax=Sporosarcina aquimarina TaxID=114975 RepID=A0ABU4G1Q6_9BACL|nr:sigma-70 family RNA polymerase sigma factor [Sporosarcina aquimarina]MDW0110910.1 sigma-70 family RNA polymerase sigma factor [Sporosarcina aquimarina]